MNRGVMIFLHLLGGSKPVTMGQGLDTLYVRIKTQYGLGNMPEWQSPRAPFILLNLTEKD